MDVTLRPFELHCTTTEDSGGDEPYLPRGCPVLEISNNGGEGVFFGKVRVLYAFAEDPSLFPPPATPLAALLNRGYELEAELGIEAVQVEMNDEYKEDVRRCMRTANEIDLKHIEVNFGKLKSDPGDPPPFRQELLDRVKSSVIVAKTVVVEGQAPFHDTQSPDVRRRKSPASPGRDKRKR